MARRLNPPLKNIFRKTNTKYNSEDNAVLDIQKTTCEFIVEGQTEVSYFNSLKSNNNLLFTIDKIINLKGCEGGGLFETCAKEIYKRLKNPRPNTIICVFDGDVCCGNNNKSNYNKFLSILSDFKNEIKMKEILICESVPSIEFWFLVHYDNNISRFMYTNDAIHELKKHIPNYSKSNSFLDKLDWKSLNANIASAIKLQSNVPEESKLSHTNNINISYSNIYKIYQTIPN